MASTYEPIATTTLGSANSTITFSSIPSTYTDLKLVFTNTVSVAGSNYILRFNSDTASNYSLTYLDGNGTSASSGRNTSQTYIYLTTSISPSTTIPAFITCDVFSYANTSVYKTSLINISLDKNGSGNTTSMVGLWRSTSAINSITLFVSSTPNTFNAGTTATLYGIRAA